MKYRIPRNSKQLKVDQTEIVTVPGAGAMIGNLERILSAIFLSLNALNGNDNCDGKY